MDKWVAVCLPSDSYKVFICDSEKDAEECILEQLMPRV
jgi:hypothetical protein